MKRRVIALTILGLLVTVYAFCEYEIRIVKALPTRYSMKSYIWLNNEEIVYNAWAAAPNQLRKLNITTGVDELLLDGEARDEEYTIYFTHPILTEKKSIIIGKSEGQSIVSLFFLFNTTSKELVEIKIGQQNKLGFGNELFAYAAGKHDKGITYFQHYLETGNLIRHDYTWEESGLQKPYNDSEIYKVYDIMDDYLLITYRGWNTALNYLTHFDGQEFSQAIAVPTDEPKRSLDLDWGAYFLKDGNILFGEDMGDNTDFDPDEAYCRLRICDRDGRILYTCDDLLFMRSENDYFTMSPDRTKIIIEGYDLRMQRRSARAYLLEIIYK